MGRSLVALSTLVGGSGLGFAIAYVLLVVMAFLPGGERLAEFMVGTEGGVPGYGYTLILVPYALLILHLWLRVNVAKLLVDRGEAELAEQYATKRLKVGLLRSKREGLANRTALMRLRLRERDYAGVEALAADAELPRRGLFRPVATEAAFHRVRFEALLREENLVACAALVDEAWPMAGRGAEVAEFCACAAELAVRNKDSEAYRTWRERSRFAEQPHVERMLVADAFAAVRFGEDVEASVVDRIEPSRLRWLEDVPGAALEVAAARAALAGTTVDDAEALLPSADRRSRHVWEGRAAAG